ncbi:helix-turn-helix transcriptional regulator [Muricauda sp. 2012CJ35-5]|uniref:Helix-turn-helix transcriptional regulator n=1 Tax=Flagellimonas spongiicola TaxID=2942208 RepID=A0ABT0PQF4_9FLAO|nr:helix-turn-helix transcriptional regulator [Allomuricauda spongiicola]MCL6273629.1 helix-turn-helix transcriptional regulator [Allomuricauda spongiicola]
MRFRITIIALLIGLLGHSQYKFHGQVDSTFVGNPVYLSLVEDYRKSSRIYLEQIISRSYVDSVGNFAFVGDNLSTTNRIYRIHLDECEKQDDTHHFMGQCNSSQSVLFIANNNDTVHFPISFTDQDLCTIHSSNSKSGQLLQVAQLKEEMIFDFMDFRSEANQKLNSKKWFARLQEFGLNAKEPLTELYIFDFLSDRKNETYPYYLQDVSNNPYYIGLHERLNNNYVGADFTRQFEAEINADKQLASFSGEKPVNWQWILGLLLAVSVSFNLYLLNRYKKRQKNNRSAQLQMLTPQEQKIVQLIMEDKTNKEIAADLFISHSTIKTHINNLYKKLNVSSRQEVVALFKN